MFNNFTSVDLHKYSKLAEWYEEYLLSKEWKALKAKIIVKRSNVCESCKTLPKDSYLILHHKTYERVTREWERDVKLLCKECHSLIDHRLIPFIDRILDRE